MSDEQQIRKLVADWMNATRAGDIDSVLAMMTEDALFLTPGNPPMSKADFAKAAASQAMAQVEIDGGGEVLEVQVMGDWAYARSHLTVTMTQGGKSTKRTGPTLTVFRKQAGSWLLARDANLLSPVHG